MATTNTPAVAPAVAVPESKVSAKVQARREAEKALRSKKVDIDAKGATVTVVKDSCPKKSGSKAAKVWSLYATGKTTEAILKEAEGLDFEKAESYARACLIWDDRHGFITVTAEVKA